MNFACLAVIEISSGRQDAMCPVDDPEEEWLEADHGCCNFNCLCTF